MRWASKRETKISGCPHHVCVNWYALRLFSDWNLFLQTFGESFFSFASVILYLSLSSVLCIVLCFGVHVERSLNRNGLLLKSITAFHHHRHCHHRSRSFTIFCLRFPQVILRNVKNRNMLIHLSTYHQQHMACCYSSVFFLSFSIHRHRHS